jgi:hypothetical protein
MSRLLDPESSQLPLVAVKLLVLMAMDLEHRLHLNKLDLATIQGNANKYRLEGVSSLKGLLKLITQSLFLT